MNWIVRTVAAAAFTLIALRALPSYAGLIGEIIYIDRVVPSTGFDFNAVAGQSGAYTVGVSPPLKLSNGNNWYGSATDTDLIMDFGPKGGGGGGAQIADHHIIFSKLFLGTGFSVTGFSIVTNTVPGISIGDISFDAHSVSVAVANANWTGGQKFEIALSSSLVPEPATAVLALCGLAGVALNIYRKRRWERS